MLILTSKTNQLVRKNFYKKALWSWLFGF